MGFTSWEGFVRRFRGNVRPTIAPDNHGLINAACEAITYRVATDVQPTDEFWLKDMPHSLITSSTISRSRRSWWDRLPLSLLDYRRWHSPVDGRVVFTKNVPGTYYAARLDDDPDPGVLSRRGMRLGRSISGIDAFARVPS